jgi:CSLREA domain-containing protein
MTLPSGYPRFLFKRFLMVRSLNSQLLGVVIIASLSGLPFLVHGLARTKRRSERTASEQSGLEAARLRETASVYAAERGNPTINLSDGHELPKDGRVEVIRPNPRQAARSSRAARLSSWKQHSLSAGSLGQASSLMRVKMSSLAGDDLLLLDESALRVFSNTAGVDTAQINLAASTLPIAALPMRLNGDALTDLVVLQKGQSTAGVIRTEAAQTFVANSTADTDDGQCTTAVNGCTLREAINAANQSAGADTINFNIAGAGLHTISPTSPLPDINEAVIIDGYTQPGSIVNTLTIGNNAVLRIELDGTNAGASANGLHIVAGNSTVQGLVINNFGGNFLTAGIFIETGGSNIVQGCFLGTDPNGALAHGNSEGIVLAGSGTNIIGGSVPERRNLISGNAQVGIVMFSNSDQNIVENNYVGTNAAGTMAIGNGLDGIQINASSYDSIGGTLGVSTRNVISGNGAAGIKIKTNGGAGTAIENLIQGNFIGTDASGTLALGNSSDGVQLTETTRNNTIGGKIKSASNIIAFNRGSGVIIESTSVENRVSDSDADPNLNNLIFQNGKLGIDLNNDGITPNDPGDPDTGANNLQNSPVITSFGSSIVNRDVPAGNELFNLNGPEIDLYTATSLTINGTLNSIPNSTFTVDWYFSPDAQCVANQQSSRPLAFGKIPGATTDSNGNASFSFQFTFPPGITSGVMNTTATDSVGNTSEFSQCFPVNSTTPTPTPTPTPLTVQLSSSSYSAGENVGSLQVVINRSGDASGTATINYATSDAAGAANCNTLNSGKASSRCDYETTVGTMSFAAGETSKAISIPIVDDVYAEGNESFTVTLSSATGAVLGSPSVATVTITDNDGTTGTTNPFTQAGYFVRMQYLDFFSREPDASGLNFWTNEIAQCGSNTQCTEIKRVNVSAAFYLSIEFRDTGYLVERIYRAAYGNGTGTSTLGGTHQFSVPVIRFEEFLPDTQEIGRGVVVGQTGWEQVLESNKQAFLNAFVQRSRFNTAFPGSLTPAQYVDALNVNAGGALSTSERNQLVTDLTNGAKTRAQVLRAVAEDADLNTAENNHAFVLMQFYGYLRRNPNDAPDADYTGYDFWLSKLNQFNGNFVNAEMVKAFIQSDEYRHRFGP